MKNPGKARSTNSKSNKAWLVIFTMMLQDIFHKKKESNGFVKSCFDAELIDSFISQTYMCTRN